MAIEDQFQASLQESILTALCFDDGKTQAIVGYLTPNLFEEPYRDIAVRALDYRARYGRAPGKEHIDDLFDHVLGDPDHKRYDRYRNILGGMLAQAPGLNVDYVVDRASRFIRTQQLKAGVLRAAERLQQGGEDLDLETERILWDTVNMRVQTMDPGVFMNDKERALNFLSRDIDALKLGIPDFDRRGIGPTRKELLMIMGARGKGKTWFLTHVGKRALMQRYKIAHITLEMSEDVCLQRYFQTFFGMAKRDEAFEQTFLELDDMQRLKGFYTDTMRPKLAMSDPNIRNELLSRIDQWGGRFGNIVVKQFPTASLRMNELRSWLDGLDRIHRFVPDIVMLDYPDLMWLDSRDLRLQLGRTIAEFRGEMQQRNMAGVAPTQPTRAGEHKDTKELTLDMAAEDISKVAHADVFLTFNQTPDEKVLNLGRLACPKVRNDDSGLQVLMTQSYKTGQFMIDSTLMRGDYFDRLAQYKQGDKDADSEGD